MWHSWYAKKNLLWHCPLCTQTILEFFLSRWPFLLIDRKFPLENLLQCVYYMILEISICLVLILSVCPTVKIFPSTKNPYEFQSPLCIIKRKRYCREKKKRKTKTHTFIIMLYFITQFCTMQLFIEMHAWYTSYYYSMHYILNMI